MTIKEIKKALDNANVDFPKNGKKAELMEIYTSLQNVEFIPAKPKTLDSELIEIKDNLNKITEETKMWVQTGLSYIIAMGTQLQAIKEKHNELFKGKDATYKAPLKRHLSDGTEIELNKIKDFWVYLHDSGHIPFKYSQISKYLRIKGIENDLPSNPKKIAALSLNDVNNASKFASIVNNGGGIAEYVDKYVKKGNLNGGRSDDRIRFELRNGDKKISISAKKDPYGSKTQVQKALLSVLVKELGFSSFSATERAAFIEQLKGLEKVQ